MGDGAQRERAVHIERDGRDVTVVVYALAATVYALAATDR